MLPMSSAFCYHTKIETLLAFLHPGIAKSIAIKIYAPIRIAESANRAYALFHAYPVSTGI
jgi:hypothetical protein